MEEIPIPEESPTAPVISDTVEPDIYNTPGHGVDIEKEDLISEVPGKQAMSPRAGDALKSEEAGQQASRKKQDKDMLGLRRSIK